tara:strand:+ start:22 stop:726 length:705 start_codon:yes stop_codon:yes gene_type:complete
MTLDTYLSDTPVYTDKDHLIWTTLFKRNQSLKNLSSIYIEGRKQIDFSSDKIEDLESISERLQCLSGWSLVPVSGLLPTKDVFSLLAKQRFPITTRIRKWSELDFAELPDVFHDLVGHVPTLATGKLTDFLVSYGETGLKLQGEPDKIKMLSRLIWYTFETGLIREDNGVYIFGGAVATSKSEAELAMGRRDIHRPFNINDIINNKYNHLEIQNCYYVINHLDELTSALDGIMH